MLIKLEHLSTRSVAEAGVFDKVNKHEELTDAIIEYGEAGDKDNEQAYNDRVGEALEVYAEFFLKRYGTNANPRLGILEATHTSNNKFQTGYDLYFRDLSGELGHIQVKFRRNPMHKFTRDELGTFISMADEDGVPAARRVLFTNQEHRPGADSNGIFHSSYTGGQKQMRVVDRTYQEEFIDRDPSFWTDLRASVAQAAQAPDQFMDQRTLRPHQQRMFDACTNRLKANQNRGRVICATGGGKTEVEYRTIRQVLLDCGGNLAIIVAPTIDLLRQHHAYFEQFGFFHRDQVSVVHFRTGDEARQDAFIDYAQTTREEDFARVMANNMGRKVLIFVTYASEEHLFSIMRKRDMQADLVVWDEFHHTVRQDIDYRNHLLTLPARHNLFFSASQKHGRVISSFDEEVYGPVLAEVPYSELREAGVLVPKIIIKPISITKKAGRLRAVERELKKAADRENFDLREALVEAAAGIVARADLHASHNRANIVTFSKGVPMCKAIAASKAVRDELAGCLLQTVHANVPARDRKAIYEKVKESDDSILLQFSVVKEGIDITPFNALVISRNMDVIGTQQGIGRVVRAHPDDTAALAAGKISLDSPEGWKKYSAVVYVIIHDHTMDNFKEFVKELVVKLEFAGFTMDDYQFGDVEEEYNGTGDRNNADVPIVNTKELFETDSLRSYVAALRVEMEREEKYNAAIESIKTVDDLRVAILKVAV